MSTRLNVAALKIVVRCHTPAGVFGPGDEAKLAPTLDRATAQTLVDFGAITPAVLGDPDAIAAAEAARIAAEKAAAEKAAAASAAEPEPEPVAVAEEPASAVAARAARKGR